MIVDRTPKDASGSTEYPRGGQFRVGQFAAVFVSAVHGRRHADEGRNLLVPHSVRVVDNETDHAAARIADPERRQGIDDRLAVDPMDVKPVLR